ncbi:very short patch repair endonuclease [Isoptericola sp. b490]|uniref:very short patch repair endonuclease n=1 Tax=Actinotalea lenta TaxID=3064654 RepID=UPI002713192F|nr:very short patch repair endonuclease [Isoptericola sp. b490]MDO8119721.1 very short patch repair endonuclease [Isoptericola sp. b490]
MKKGPVPSSEAASARMRRHPRRDTGPELAVRRLLHARGLRYRVCYPVPEMPRRTIDIAFTRAKVAVFIDGCFWHGCPAHKELPKANHDWWAAKIEQNRSRDAGTTAHLMARDWIVVRLWEHDDPVKAISTIVTALAAREEGQPDLARRSADS